MTEKKRSVRQKLDVEKVKEIRHRFRQRETVQSLSKVFKVTDNTIRDIVQRRTWTDV